MLKLNQQIETFFSAHPAERYFLACSGGIDSMVLASLMLAQALPLELVHVNYGLRGDESDKDQLFLDEFCQRHCIPFHAKKVNLREFLNEHGGNLQEEARKVRYAFFEEILVDHGAKVVLAHHADDQVETFFLNLARGGGMMGLSGMLAAHGHYLRPLLPFRKQQLLDYAHEHGLTWREDRTNAESYYSRNKLRNMILPELGASFPDLVDQITFLTHIFQENQADLEKRMALMIAEFSPKHFIPLDKYDSLNELERIELLRQFNLPLGILPEVNKLAKAEKGKVLNFSGTAPGRLIREQSGFYVEVGDLDQHKHPGTLEIEANATLPEVFSKSAIYLNPNLISGDIQLRFWQVGDRMKPIGMNGSKLISDIITDAKVPHHLRQAQRVLVDDHRILWCVGHAVSGEAIAKLGQPCIKVTVND